MIYRYKSVRGLEYREAYSCYWKHVTGEMVLGMSADELREIADVMSEAQEQKELPYTPETTRVASDE